MNSRILSRFPLLRAFGVLLLLGALALPAVAAKRAKQLDVADTISTKVIESHFAEMLQASELATFLASKGPFTVFVPTNSAFSKLPPGTLETLLRPENKERLQHILLIHVLLGKKIIAHDLVPLTSLKPCEGTLLPLKRNRLGIQLVQKAKVVHGDIKCENGIIHEIDTVLMPPETSMPAVAAPPAPGAAPVPPVASTNAAPVL